jgi:hypothetical protein
MMQARRPRSISGGAQNDADLMRRLQAFLGTARKTTLTSCPT